MIATHIYIPPLSLNATFRVVFLIIPVALTQICMTLKVVVYLRERRDTVTTAESSEFSVI